MFRLEFFPQLERSLDQRYVARVFKVALTNDSSLAMRTAAIMCDTKAIDTGHAFSLFSQMVQRCTADSTGT
jgi:hypothetical protein